jgi:hypothetical protein
MFRLYDRPNVAVTVRFDVTVTVHWLPMAVSHPLHPWADRLKLVKPEGGVVVVSAAAVSVMVVPEATPSAQSAGQLMPVAVTVPTPSPAVMTARVYVWAWAVPPQARTAKARRQRSAAGSDTSRLYRPRSHGLNTSTIATPVVPATPETIAV